MFPEKYARLEQGFQDQVECDRRKYEPGGRVFTQLHALRTC